MRPTRYDDWQARLNGYMARVVRTTFDNCGIFAGDAIEVMTGIDPIADIRSKGTVEAMVLKIKSLGFKGPVEYIASKYREVTPVMALPGDLAILPSENGPSFGIIQGDYVYAVGANVGIRSRGIVTVPLGYVERAFAI